MTYPEISLTKDGLRQHMTKFQEGTIIQKPGPWTDEACPRVPRNVITLQRKSGVQGDSIPYQARIVVLADPRLDPPPRWPMPSGKDVPTCDDTKIRWPLLPYSGLSIVQ